MIRRIFRALGFRRRSSIKLTPQYEARRIARLRNCRELFAQGRVGAHFNRGAAA